MSCHCLHVIVPVICLYDVKDVSRIHLQVATGLPDTSVYGKHDGQQSLAGCTSKNDLDSDGQTALHASRYRQIYSRLVLPFHIIASLQVCMLL